MERDTMEILEQRADWEAAFRTGWLAHYERSGETDWKQYQRPKNSVAPAGPAIDLSRSRLVLISSAGGYLPASQEPFDAANVMGDYSIRLIPTDTPFAEIAYAHDHYDHTAVNDDPQVLLPLEHLQQLVAEGVIGALTPHVISFMGYQPDVGRVLDELIPQIRAAVQTEQAEAAFLVPS
jgi:Glycine/sarcosine/betaine reductase selenoprotein B (GRDB)